MQHGFKKRELQKKLEVWNQGAQSSLAIGQSFETSQNTLEEMEKFECQGNVYPNKRHNKSEIAQFGEKKTTSFLSVLLLAMIALTT